MTNLMEPLPVILKCLLCQYQETFKDFWQYEINNTSKVSEALLKWLLEDSIGNLKKLL